MLDTQGLGRARLGHALGFFLAGSMLIAACTCTPVHPARAENDAAELPSHAHQTLHLVFSRKPRWASGLEAGSSRIRQLSDPALVLSAGLRGGLEASRPVRPSIGAAEPGWSSLPHEEEAYPNGDAIQGDHLDPFSVVGGNLVITASPLPPEASADLPADMPRKFLSGAFNTFPFCQTYGYFEVTAKVPAGRGLWPAIWLLPADGSWPPEIDAPEVLGDNTGVAYFSLHTQDHAWIAQQSDSYASSVTTDRFRAGTDLAGDFHRYGVDWERDRITFYFDGSRVASRSTPADMHKPFYLIVNLAVGGKGSWPGRPDNATMFPASLIIKSVDVWTAGR